MSKFAVQQSVWDRGHAMQQVTSHRGPDGTWRAIRRGCTSAACALLATTSSIWCAPAIARQISGTTGLSIDSVRSEINWTLDSGTVAPGGSMSLVSGHTRRPAAEGFLGEDPKGQVVIVSLSCTPTTGMSRRCWLMNTPITGGRSTRALPILLPRGVITAAQWRTTIMISTTSGTYLRLTSGKWRRLTTDAGNAIILRGSEAVLDAFVGPFLNGETADAIDAIQLPQGPVQRVAAATLAKHQCACATISHVGSPALDGHYLYWLETSTVVNAYYFAYPPPPLFAVCRLKIGAPTTSAAWWRAPQPIGWITVTGSQIDAVAGTYYSRSPGIFSCSASWTSPTTPLAPEAGTPCSRT